MSWYVGLDHENLGLKTKFEKIIPLFCNASVSFSIIQVLSVKQRIEETQGKDAFPCSQQLLIYKGKVLKDDTTMEENGVVENSFLVVMLSKVIAQEIALWILISFLLLKYYCMVC